MYCLVWFLSQIFNFSTQHLCDEVWEFNECNASHKHRCKNSSQQSCINLSLFLSLSFCQLFLAAATSFWCRVIRGISCHSGAPGGSSSHISQTLRDHYGKLLDLQVGFLYTTGVHLIFHNCFFFFISKLQNVLLSWSEAFRGTKTFQINIKPKTA